MRPEKLGNAALVAAVVAAPRTHSLLAELYRRFLPRMVYEAAAVLKGDARSAADVAQATMANVLTKGSLRGVVEPEKVEAYLAVAARRTAIDFRRRIRRDEIPFDNLDALPNSPVDEAEAQANADATDELLWVLGRLAPDEQDILRQRYLEDKSLRELSVIIGISYEATAQRVSRALRKARAIMAQRG